MTAIRSDRITLEDTSATALFDLCHKSRVVRNGLVWDGYTVKKRCVPAIVFTAAFIHLSSCTATLYEPRSPLVPGVVFSEFGNLRNLGVIDKGREFDWIVVARVVGDNASKLNGNSLGRKATTGFSDILEVLKGHSALLGDWKESIVSHLERIHIHTHTHIHTRHLFVDSTY